MKAMDQISVLVDFSGISRMITGKSEFPMQLPQGATVENAIQELAKTFPKLIGEIIDPDGKQLIASNIFSLKGEKIISESETDYPLTDGDQLILLSLLSGG